MQLFLLLIFFDFYLQLLDKKAQALELQLALLAQFVKLEQVESVTTQLSVLPLATVKAVSVAFAPQAAIAG